MEQTAGNNEMLPGEFNTAGEQTAYKTGFADGFAAATQAENRTVGATSSTVNVLPAALEAVRRVRGWPVGDER